MPLRVFTNLPSLNAQRALAISQARLGSSIERIASGIRINRASDDSAALAISEALRSDVRALKQGSRNLNDGVAMINSAEGAMSEQASILIRLRELASQSATGTIGQAERVTLNLEFSALKAEFDRIAATVEFNGQKLLDGSLSASSGNSIILQIGLNSDEANRINLNQELNLTAVTSRALNFSANTVITDTSALSSMDNLTAAIDELIDIRGRVGALQNRLTHAFNNLQSSIEGLTQAVSTIRDADLAEEFAELTKNQILVQAGAAMIGQANLIPQVVLSLFQ